MSVNLGSYYEDDFDGDDLEKCHHGVGFDEECEECELETQVDEAAERETDPPEISE